MRLDSIQTAAEKNKEKERMEEKGRCSSSDEISLFLHHFLLRSSPPSSSSNCAPPNSSLPQHPFSHHFHIPPPHASGDGIPPAGIDPSFAYAARSARASHAPSSSSVGASENDDEEEADEYDCESEEGLEALLEEVAAKPNTSRISSKRSRTAQVHNLSEKRRRSRINEKMKALQSLIPNSNKTDKASMLDEAIEYLKQLQLQVQMLSMRRKGLSLQPMWMPGPIQAQMLGEEDIRNDHLQQEITRSQTLFERRPEPSSIPHIFTSDSPPFWAARPFHLDSEQEICRDRNQQSNIINSESSIFDTYLPKPDINPGARETLSLPFGSQPSITKSKDPLRG